MSNSELQILKDLAESVLFAIDSGDWQVDGRNDPELCLERVKTIMARNGYKLDELCGYEFVRG